MYIDRTIRCHAENSGSLLSFGCIAFRAASVYYTYRTLISLLSRSGVPVLLVMFLSYAALFYTPGYCRIRTRRLRTSISVVTVA